MWPNPLSLLQRKRHREDIRCWGCFNPPTLHPGKKIVFSSEQKLLSLSALDSAPLSFPLSTTLRSREEKTRGCDGLSQCQVVFKTTFKKTGEQFESVSPCRDRRPGYRSVCCLFGKLDLWLQTPNAFDRLARVRLCIVCINVIGEDRRTISSLYRQVGKEAWLAHTESFHE